METKRNLKYFTTVGLPIVLIIGVAILGIGVLGAIIFKKLSFYFIVTAVVGAAIAIFASGGKANDTDLDYECHEKTKDIEESAEKHFAVFERNFLKMIRPVQLSGFQYDAEDLLARKGSDGRHRTNIFGASIMLFTNEKMYFYKRLVSLVKEDANEDVPSVVYYKNLDKAFIEEGDYEYVRGNKQYHVHTYQFVVVDIEGNEVYRMFIDYGADSDKAVEDINHVFDVRKKALEEREAERLADKAAREAALAAKGM